MGDSYRGSYMIGADGKLYQDSQMRWQVAGERQITTIQTLHDRAGTVKTQTQVFDVLPFAMRGAKIRRPTEISGPGCAICGVNASERYTYDPYSGQMATQCDADGLMTRMVYNDGRYVEAESKEAGDVSCPAPSYIIAGAVTSTVVTLRSNRLNPSAVTLEKRPSVLDVGGEAGQISDYDDPVSDPTPEIPNNWWPAAR